MQAGVSVYQPINANLNARSCRTISESVDPFAIRLDFYNPQYSSVAHAQHVSSEIRDSLDSGKASRKARTVGCPRCAAERLRCHRFLGCGKCGIGKGP